MFFKPATIGFEALVSEPGANATVIVGPLPPIKPKIRMKIRGNAMLKTIDDGDFIRAVKLAFEIAHIALY